MNSYWINGKNADIDGGETLPDTWHTPYKFKVTAVQ